MNLRRRMMMANVNKLPYDAEVEWLMSDGDAYIDTGISGNSRTTTFELEILADTIANRSLFGSRKTSSTRFCWTMSPTTTFIQVGYGSSYGNISVGISSGDNIIISTSISGSQITYTVQNITTGVSNSLSYNLTTFDTVNLLLFWSSALNKSLSPVKRLKIYNDGVLAGDFKPVRASGVGYLYDSVSRSLFGNANSSGAFTYGNDV